MTQRVPRGAPAMRVIRRALAIVATIGAALASLFLANGLLLAARATPVAGITSATASAPPREGERIRIMTYNVAKAFAHRGGHRFASTGEVRARLARIADVINAERPDLLFIQEALFACSPCPVNQIAELATATEMRWWIYGENYDVGLPFLRVAGGNAILSRFPVTPAGNPDLPGRKPFWVSTNNRRLLLANARIGEATIALCAVHADSFSLASGARQFEFILTEAAGRPAVLAGDFNAEPHDRSLELCKASGRFSGEIDGGAPTFPAGRPIRRIDFVLGPRTWEHVTTRVIDSDASDHAAVVADFVVRN